MRHVIPLAGVEASSPFSLYSQTTNLFQALAWTFCATALLLTLGRFYIRLRSLRKLQWDDILNGAALAALVVFTVTFQVYFPIEYNAELYSLGLSEIKNTTAQTDFSIKVNLANVFSFWVVIYFVKASFLALYWNVFKVSARFRKAWWIVTIYTATSFCITFLAVLWSCSNPRTFAQPAACKAVAQPLVVNVVTLWCTTNVIGDLLIVALPVSMLRSLQMGRYQKIGLAAVFAISIIDIVFDILRTVYTASSYLSNFPDDNAVWAISEPTIAVIICALPSYRGLLSRKGRKPSPSHEESDRVALDRKSGYSRARELDDLSAYSLHSGPET